MAGLAGPVPIIHLRSSRAHPALVFLALVVSTAVCFQAFLVIATPPNAWDSFAYHLAKAAEWHQRGAVEYYPTHSQSVNATQPNAEMLTLYTFAFASRDTFAAVPQLLAEAAAVLGVYRDRDPPRVLKVGVGFRGTAHGDPVDRGSPIGDHTE